MDRPSLQVYFEQLLDTNNVYFQPPTSYRMRYPALVYEFSGYFRVRADNRNYQLRDQYTLTYIHSDPDDPNTRKLEELEWCTFERRLKIDNYYHDVYNLYT